MIQVQVTRRIKLKNQIEIENVNNYWIVTINKLFYYSHTKHELKKYYINLLVKYIKDTKSIDDEIENDRQVDF